MKISDDLRDALYESGHPLGLLDEKFKSLQVSVVNLIPRIETLERCRELLAKYHWVEHEAHGEDGIMTWCICCDSFPPNHTPDCEIATALEATP